eukprot:CAMPEP_0206206818 /NCGR_PEP_ID=MMETSP0166-20121206/15214_1 /ASSEMBLY_ACC=CAM_ASM_000260 /TAXON_ID=95228 /ORGANISM="Vannella robusta, Strain DIVA3 518/3/11/1/6" /LENGTH=107 /DNA_ID=CAMNT_0053627445 /DNA_START=657 /DNA_END=977 /DNA_ORIENTATION=+
MNYFVQPVVEVPPTKSVPVSPSPIPTPVKIGEVNKELSSSMTDADRRLHEETLKFVSQNNETEQTILEKRNYGLDTNAPIQCPASFFDPDDATFRLFCSNLGLNSLA